MSIDELQSAREAIRPALEEAFRNALAVCRLVAEQTKTSPGRDWTGDDARPLLTAMGIGVLLDHSPQDVLGMVEPL